MPASAGMTSLLCFKRPGSGALDMAEQTARPGGVGVDIGNVLAGEDAAHRGLMAVAFDDRVGVVDHHAVAAEGAEGDQPVAHDVRNGVRLLVALAIARAHKDRRGMAVDTLRLWRLVGEKQHAALAWGFAQAVPAWVAAIEIEALDGVAEIVARRTAQASGVIGTHRDAAE